ARHSAPDLNTVGQRAYRSSDVCSYDLRCTVCTSGVGEQTGITCPSGAIWQCNCQRVDLSRRRNIKNSAQANNSGQRSHSTTGELKTRQDVT
ncbi:hypothetical protein, partial [Enterobacter hormaechei]|uniref:hypothetical protein n=1 Tax=Enterobacter hormaechei TaxID=158836 RepID=UPI003D14318B